MAVPLRTPFSRAQRWRGKAVTREGHCRDMVALCFPLTCRIFPLTRAGQNSSDKTGKGLRRHQLVTFQTHPGVVMSPS